MSWMWYVGLDVHQETTAASFRNEAGDVVRREVVATTSSDLRGLFRRMGGHIQIAVEAGALATRVATILTTKKRHVIVCDARRNRLLSSGTKTDCIDADKLSDLLRLRAIRPVYVGDIRNQRLRHLAHHYLKLVRDRARAVQRLRSLLAAFGLDFTRRSYSRRAVPYRAIRDKTCKFIASALVEQIETLTPIVDAARVELLREAAKDPSFTLLQTVPYVGPMRAAELLAIIGTPERFRSARKFLAYSGLAVERRVSSEHRMERGKSVRKEKKVGLRRLNRNGHPRLKKIMKDIALGASLGRGEFRALYEFHVASGKRPPIARVVLARRIAGVILSIWRAGAPYDASKIKLKTSVRGEHQPGHSSSVLD